MWALCTPWMDSACCLAQRYISVEQKWHQQDLRTSESESKETPAPPHTMLAPAQEGVPQTASPERSQVSDKC